MAFDIVGREVAEVLREFMAHHGAVMAEELDGVMLDFALDDFVDDLCLRLADNPGLPIAGERPELRAVLGIRILVVLHAALSEEDDAFLSVSEKPSLRMVVGSIFGRLLAGARLPPEWSGELYPRDLASLGHVERP
jgi:hypothetical protein